MREAKEAERAHTLDQELQHKNQIIEQLMKQAQQ